MGFSSRKPNVEEIKAKNNVEGLIETLSCNSDEFIREKAACAFLKKFVANFRSPEMVDALLRKAFEESVRNKEFIKQYIKEALLELKSELSRELVSAALSAAGYTVKKSDEGYEIDLKDSEKGIMYLCEHNCQATTNILHLVAQKKDVSTSVSFYCGDCFEIYECKESCQSQRVIALKELEKRGNPPYELKAYFKFRSLPS